MFTCRVVMCLSAICLRMPDLCVNKPWAVIKWDCMIADDFWRRCTRLHPRVQKQIPFKALLQEAPPPRLLTGDVIRRYARWRFARQVRVCWQLSLHYFVPFNFCHRHCVSQRLFCWAYWIFNTFFLSLILFYVLEIFTASYVNSRVCSRVIERTRFWCYLF